MKNKKSTGIYNISAEMIKALEEKQQRNLYCYASIMYGKGEWPDYSSKSIVVPIEKKATAINKRHTRKMDLYKL